MKLNSKISFDICNVDNYEIKGSMTPAAILLNYRGDENSKTLHSLVEYWLKNGAVLFATMGENAKIVEDAIDWVIVDCKKEEIVTTEHSKETLEEVLDFVILHMGLNFDEYRVVFISDKDDKSSEKLKAMIKLKNEQSAIARRIY